MPPFRRDASPAAALSRYHAALIAGASDLRGVASSGFDLEDYNPNPITRASVLDTDAHESLPPGRSRLVFDRLTIPPGTTMMAEAATGQDWFAIDTGQLGRLPPGSGVGHTSGNVESGSAGCPPLFPERPSLVLPGPRTARNPDGTTH